MTLSVLFIASLAFSNTAYASMQHSAVVVHSSVQKGSRFAGKLINQRVYLDFEALEKIFPLKVLNWVAETNTLYMRGDSYPDLKTVEFKFENGKDYFTVDDKEVKTGLKLMMFKDRMYIPVRAITNYFHYNLKWDSRHKTVDLSVGAKIHEPVIQNTVKLSKDEVNKLVDVTVGYFNFANAKDFENYCDLMDTKPTKFAEFDPLFFVWKDAEKSKLKLRRIDFVVSNDNSGTPRVIADVKWTTREAQIAYFKRGENWTIASLD